MTNECVQAQYEQLGRIVTRFGSEAEAVTQMQQRLRQQVERLQRSGWQGEGATAFFQEMDTLIFPALTRLSHALATAQTATVRGSQILHEAEREAALLFSERGERSGKPEPTPTSALNLPTTVGNFQLGSPIRPNIQHDNGFLDHFPPRWPTFDDLKEYAKWRTALNGMLVETLAGKNSLDDSLIAYAHFLMGFGADKRFGFDEFVREDANGTTTLKNALFDATEAAEGFGKGITEGTFQFTSNAYFAGSDDPRFPYPATENWQKAIGGYAFWTSADVQVSTAPDGRRQYTMDFILHAEDRYNFNPGMQDIASGIPDNENGRFELTGLAKQYMHYGETHHTIRWIEGEEPDLSAILPTSHPEEDPSELFKWLNDIRTSSEGG